MQDTEAVWLVQAQRGDQQAFTNIVEAYQKPVFNLCYRMLNNAEDAEDAAQETFLRAYRSIKQYDHNRQFSTWLLSIAAHYCIDQIRKNRMNIISLEDQPNQEIPDTLPGPESSLSKREEQNRMRLLLEKLNPIDRAAVVMYYWYDYSYDEIAQSLSLSESAIKSRLHRARKEMARLWISQQNKLIPAERKCHESPVF
ncbi:MAG: RNA polymerase sigma factor [Chloroflexi bacterium]|nr:RNA polymerase sigma factor [Chloroflexota bacterium]